jgi:hypothetical protein
VCERLERRELFSFTFASYLLIEQFAADHVPERDVAFAAAPRLQALEPRHDVSAADEQAQGCARGEESAASSRCQPYVRTIGQIAGQISTSCGRRVPIE